MSHFDQLLKIDDYTTYLSQSRFARVYVEIDLSKLLKRGLWIGDKEHRVFLVVLYEKLPTFCYLCGLVGYGSNTCSRRSSDNQNRPSQSP